MPSPPPLTDLRVLELSGLAPGPYAGLLLAQYGASVLRIDRPSTVPSADQLTAHKSCLPLDLKNPASRALFLSLAATADVLIDPYRPGVLESLSLTPATLLRHNPRLIIARMTGFRRDGKYAKMAGHDINYLSVSGVLSLLGRAGQKPHAPGNILGDFAGGGHVLFTGILMALLERERSGRGQVVEANMVDGVAHLATYPRYAMRGPAWDRPRGENLLDAGCPFYDTYETSDGGHVAVGALEPQFFKELLRGLGISEEELGRDRMDRGTWEGMRRIFEEKFRGKTRSQWEAVFDGTDACVTPVLGMRELERGGYEQRPLVTLRETPGLALEESGGARQPERGQGKGQKGGGWKGAPLKPGQGGEDVLRHWMGWEKGRDYDEVDGKMIKLDEKAKAKL